ncbi:hypothetical protein D3C80_1937740 [compost metagenome]
MLQGCTVSDRRLEKTANNASARTAPNIKVLPNILFLPDELASCKFNSAMPSTAKAIAISPRLSTRSRSHNQDNSAISDGRALVMIPALVAAV